MMSIMSRCEVLGLEVELFQIRQCHCRNRDLVSLYGRRHPREVWEYMGQTPWSNASVCRSQGLAEHQDIRSLVTRGRKDCHLPRSVARSVWQVWWCKMRKVADRAKGHLGCNHANPSERTGLNGVQRERATWQIVVLFVQGRAAMKEDMYAACLGVSGRACGMDGGGGYKSRRENRGVSDSGALLDVDCFERQWRWSEDHGCRPSESG
ncbi:hypothetical protein HDK77DRAFT_132742 [Phyllosticta capitalensis]|uniref:Uncharacterized protein n=1 Tax=Phyllosticta capitalensis TaxID=121624 RepID=A0ABR1Z1Y3_9PEZI